MLACPTNERERRIDEYLAEAEKCEAEADKTQDEAERSYWLELADAWRHIVVLLRKNI